MTYAQCKQEAEKYALKTGKRVIIWKRPIGYKQYTYFYSPYGEEAPSLASWTHSIVEILSA